MRRPRALSCLVLVARNFKLSSSGPARRDGHTRLQGSSTITHAAATPTTASARSWEERTDARFCERLLFDLTLVRIHSQTAPGLSGPAADPPKLRAFVNFS